MNFCILLRPFWIEIYGLNNKSILFLFCNSIIDCLFLKAIKVVEKGVESILESNDVLPNDELSRERHLLGRWRPWDNFFIEVTHMFLLNL